MRSRLATSTAPEQVLSPGNARSTSHNPVLRIIPSKRDTAQRALGRVVVDLQRAVVAVTRERRPAGEHIADRLAQCRLLRDLHQGLFEPCVQRFEQRPGTGLANHRTVLRFAAADLLFDDV